ncbi:MAG TPA: caspase family protein, partial [Actinoplanes sp.]|nr:caspase family protein [Actinoplanes sp.]
MAAKLFALLVGIDRYQAPDVPRLRGCVNDIDRMTALLAAREDDVDLRVLRDAEATRAAVIDAFRSHLGQAGPDDIALFYCASHGSQGVAPPEFRRQEQDHLLETLVCHDSRTPGVPDLADKELAKLIREVADPGTSVVVVLDACHSANGTREPGPGVRRAPVDERPRPVDTFLVDPADALAPPAGSDSGWTTGRHILLAACHTTEVSREVFMGDRQCG